MLCSGYSKLNKPLYRVFNSGFSFNDHLRSHKNKEIANLSLLKFSVPDNYLIYGINAGST